MDLLSRVGSAGLNLSRSLTDQAHRVAALSSGLRIRNAADDPSGLAIAESLSSRVAGLHQGHANVQTALNLLNVTESALKSVTAVLQRIRSLVVQAASDIQSASALQSIQTEIDALKIEINHIVAKAQFNGVHLLDGALDRSAQANAVVQEINPSPVNGAVPVRTVVNADGLGNAGALITGATVGNGVEATTIQFSVTGYDLNAVDPIIGPIGGPGLYVQVIAYSNDASFGAGKQITSITAVPENAGPQVAVLTTPSGSSTFLQFTIANLTSADVGAAQAFTTYHDLPAATGNPLSVNLGAGEGAILQLSIPQMSTRTLGMADITVVAPSTVDDFNVPQGTASSNATAAVDAEVRTSTAIQMVVALQAQVGAQSVSLQEESSNNALAAVELAASQSAIVSADMPAESSAYTRNAVMIEIAQSAMISAEDGARAFGQAMADNIGGKPGPVATGEAPPLNPPAKPGV